ncbi:hypothetical protein PENTCL1PPCAC_13543, partial [Pristionchus entomophagus]
PTVPVFVTCGMSFSLNGVDLPDYIIINQSFSETGQMLPYNGDNVDVTINIGSNTLYGHKDILATCIPFFNALFNSNMTECKTGEIKISLNLLEFEFSTFESLLEYAYSGHL